ncbi:MAG TPA: hypothetical protein VE954_28225 [Oligoflexus sp.]|uniref:hypothetical protein n=1 Tax=Oligoflexus sp. TaxID=1971216 RepID=UPI002D35374A|nr:hypothetical protein [Oligoflexus sp.]HYX37006.1 hypothetical protein [Oligoflexus sp.]
MKSMIALGMGCLLTTHAFAATKAVPVPKNVATCVASITDKGYCVETEAASFPINVRFYIVVDKETYPTVEGLLEKYLAFDAWPAYTETVGSDAIVFNKSARLDDLTLADGNVVARHYYDYKLKSPIGYQKVRGVSHNLRLAAPYGGALGTIEFTAQTTGPQEVPAGEKALNGAEGVKLQTGIINAVECKTNALCSEGQWLLTYESTITPAITLLPKVAASSIEQGLETVLVGMLFN